jgi:hypothetical protein
VIKGSPTPRSFSSLLTVDHNQADDRPAIQEFAYSKLPSSIAGGVVQEMMAKDDARRRGIPTSESELVVPASDVDRFERVH